MSEAAAFVGVLFVLGLLGSGVAALIVALAARSRMKTLELKARLAAEATDRLEKQLLDLKREVRILREGVGGAAPAPATEAPVRQEVPPVIEPPPVVDVPPVIEAPPVIEVPPVIGEAAAAPPVPPAPPPFEAPPSEPPPVEPPARRFDWEGLVGVKLFSWVAGVALALAAVFFLRYSIDQGWLSPAVRSVIGLLVGISLVVGCELKVARRYSVTANALDGAGLFTLFATAFAAHSLWHLIGALAAFLFMALVAAAAVGLSIRRESLFIALLGLLGAFSTPALLSTGEDRPFGLFGYLLLLNVGLAWVARRKRWGVLGLLALLGTTFYQWGWVAKFLAPGKLPLALGIFLVFPLVSVLLDASQRQGSEGSDGDEPRATGLFRTTVTASAALPALFAFYLAAVPAYGGRFGLLFGFLFVLVAGLSAVAIARDLPLLHVAAGLSTLAVLAVYLSVSYTHGAWPAILAIVAAFVLLHLGVALAAARFGHPLEGAAARFVALVPALVLFAFPALVALEPAAAAPGPVFGVLFILSALLAAFALAREEALVHFAAALFVLAAEALWSTSHLTRERLLPALLVYGGFALFYLGVPLLARRLGRTLRPEGSGSVALLLSIGLLFFFANGPLAAAALWGMALLLALLNLGLVLEARTSFGARVALLGTLLSWGVLLAWWSVAPLEALLVPALVVTAGFAVVVLGGALGAARAGAAPSASQGAYLALVGHLFLLFVASQARLSIPPWPILAVLAVLTLALGAASLWTGNGALHLSGVVASQAVLFVWLTAARTAPWPSVGLAAAALVGLFGIAWLLLARRRGLDGRAFADAAVAGLFLAEAVALVAVMAPGAPFASLFALFQLALAAALLGVAWLTLRFRVAVFAVAATLAASLAWSGERFDAEGWRAELLVATAILVPFLLFPLVLGARVEGRREPHLAAVLATVPFFFAADHALTAGHYEPVIGLLPLALAAALLILLRRLLRLEGVIPRDEARLALVAGAVLSYVTVTIPLQLEKEWITIGWALQAAALAWLYRRIPHRGLLFFSGTLYATVFARLVLNTAVFDYHPRGTVAVFNWYLYTYLVAAAAFFLGAALFRTTGDDLPARLPRVSTLLPPGGTVLLFLLLNIEIADFYSTGAHVTFNFLSSSLGQDLTYTLGWALFAIALLAAGIARRSRGARVAALVLLVVTILKCFLHDLWRLGGLLRVASFVGLAISLALVAVALQRFVLAPARDGE